MKETFSDDELQLALSRGECVVGFQPDLNRWWSWYKKAADGLYEFIEPCDEDHSILLKRMAGANVLDCRVSCAVDGLCFLLEPIR